MSESVSAHHETLQGEVASVVYQDLESGFGVVLLDTPEGARTAAGALAPAAPGEQLRLHGVWEVHPRYGRRFRVAWAERTTPTTLGGLQRYLAGGSFPGIGPEFARRIVEYFGTGTLAALEAGETRLRLVPTLGKKRAKDLASAYRARRDQHRVMAELRGFGLNEVQARRAYQQWESGAVERVHKDPYALIGNLPGVGIESAERIAAQLGMPADSPARARGLALHLLREGARAGHTCLPAAILLEALATRGILEHVAASACGDLVSSSSIREETDGNKIYYLFRLWEDESGVARHVRRLLGQERRPAVEPEQVIQAIHRAPLRPDASQQCALEMALCEPFAVLTGGPGTGKTTTLRLLLDALEASGRGPIGLASPTGRAAKRLQEATGRPASTLHRMLGFDPRSMRFRHDEHEPLPLRHLVVDEVSMLDLPLAHALLRAVPDGCRVLLVGDADQLPSVGPGSVLRDLVHSPIVPHARLQRIHRQETDSGIVEAAHAVLEGRVPDGAPQRARGDFFVVLRPNSREAGDMVERLACERIPQRYGIDPRRDLLVLSPMYRGVLGVDELNRRLGTRLNPDGGGGAWCAPFRTGDRVMAVRNDYEREVFNGDTGIVTAILDGELVVDFGAAPQTYRREQLDDLVQAWCVTVHRAQGSEARAVIVVLGRSHYLLLRRSLLYTALTRGRELVVIVADPGALRQAVGNASESRRYGRLRERLSAAAP